MKGTSDAFVHFCVNRFCVPWVWSVFQCGNEEDLVGPFLAELAFDLGHELGVVGGADAGARGGDDDEDLLHQCDGFAHFPGLDDDGRLVVGIDAECIKSADQLR